jgi:uncharacterized membrane protein
MNELQEIIRLRIDALQHTRQLIVAITAGISTIYTILVTFAEKDLVSCGIVALQFHRWFCIFIIVSLVITILSFILAIFLLTDAIHHYSKIAEYAWRQRYPKGYRKAAKSHVRALAADDLSYYGVRIGIFSLVTHIMTVFALIIFETMLFHHFFKVAIVLIIIGWITVIYCYYVSHYELSEYTLVKIICKFFNPFRWKEAVKK